MRSFLAVLLLALVSGCASPEKPLANATRETSSSGPFSSNVPATSIASVGLFEAAAQTVCSYSNPDIRNHFRKYYDCVTVVPIAMSLGDTDKMATGTYDGFLQYPLKGIPSYNDLANPTANEVTTTQVARINSENFATIKQRIEDLRQGCMGSQVSISKTGRIIELTGGNYFGDSQCQAARAILKAKTGTVFIFEKVKGKTAEVSKSANNRVAELQKIMNDTYTSIEDWQEQSRRAAAEGLKDLAKKIAP